MRTIYDPTNHDNLYLEELEISISKKEFLKSNIYDSSDKCKDTLKLILFYENNRRDYIKKGIDLKLLLNRIEKLNIRFREKYGDWFHHDNKYYNYFYELINKNKY